MFTCQKYVTQSVKCILNKVKVMQRRRDSCDKMQMATAELNSAGFLCCREETRIYLIWSDLKAFPRDFKWSDSEQLRSVYVAVI